MMSRKVMAAVRTVLVTGAVTAAGVGQVSGQMFDADETWRLTAAVGGFAPRAAAIVGADGRDTRLGAGPSFSLEVQYAAMRLASIYVNGTTAFSTLARGTEIQPGALGPSDQVTVIAGTAGAMLGLTGLHPEVVPTLRLGGGIKGYLFDLTGADSQWRPTGDIGVGFRSGGTGSTGVHAEVRYMPSSFDQARLPTRGITPQEQRQTDLLFSVGVSIRL